MRIGFDAKRAFHNFRGLGNYARNLLQGLGKYSPHNDYHLYTPLVKDARGLEWLRKNKYFSLHEPISIVEKKINPLWRSFLIGADLTRDRLDIYHGLSHELPLGIEKKTFKKVVTIHDLIYLKFPEYFSWIDRKIYDLKFRHACQVSDRIVAICNQTREDLIEHFNMESEKISVCYQSCDERFYKSIDESKKKSIKFFYNLPQDFALYVGAFERRKNVLRLIRSLAATKNDLPLVLVGDGSQAYKKEMNRLINSLGLSRRIFIHSSVSSRDLIAFYQQAKMFIFPSFYEGFGIPIIEAQFSEIPVITSFGSCFPETAGDGALFIDPSEDEDIANAIDRLCDDSGLAHSLVRKGRKHVEKFHSAETTKALVEVYKSL